MPTNKSIRFLSIFHKYGGPVNLTTLFSDTTTSVTDTQIIRERRQEIEGQTFVVSSVFDRCADKTAGDKLLSLIGIEAEKESRSRLN